MTGRFKEVPTRNDEEILAMLQEQLPEGIVVMQIIDLGEDYLEAGDAFGGILFVKEKEVEWQLAPGGFR